MNRVMSSTGDERPASAGEGSTRPSLLLGLKESDNQRSWREFYETYGKLIINAGLRAGLTRAEAEEVLQETALSVVKHIRRFRIDPAKGSFKNWLMRMTRWRINDQRKKRIPRKAGSVSPRRDGTARTATINRIPDPTVNEQSEWDTDWRQNCLTVALDRVKRKVKAKHFQIFYLYALKELPLKEVSRRLKARPSLIYVTKYRIQRLLEKELRLLGLHTSREHG